MDIYKPNKFAALVGFLKNFATLGQQGEIKGI